MDQPGLIVEGWLIKKKGKDKNIFFSHDNLRWFKIIAVQGSDISELALCYFKNQKDKDARGWIYLKDVIEISDDTKAFTVVSSSRTMTIEAQSVNEYLTWLQTLVEHCPNANTANIQSKLKVDKFKPQAKFTVDETDSYRTKERNKQMEQADPKGKELKSLFSRHVAGGDDKNSFYHAANGMSNPNGTAMDMIAESNSNRSRRNHAMSDEDEDNTPEFIMHRENSLFNDDNNNSILDSDGRNNNHHHQQQFQHNQRHSTSRDSKLSEADDDQRGGGNRRGNNNITDSPARNNNARRGSGNNNSNRPPRQEDHRLNNNNYPKTGGAGATNRLHRHISGDHLASDNNTGNNNGNNNSQHRRGYSDSIANSRNNSGRYESMNELPVEMLDDTTAILRSSTNSEIRKQHRQRFNSRDSRDNMNGDDDDDDDNNSGFVGSNKSKNNFKSNDNDDDENEDRFDPQSNNNSNNNKSWPKVNKMSMFEQSNTDLLRSMASAEPEDIDPEADNNDGENNNRSNYDLSSHSNSNNSPRNSNTQQQQQTFVKAPPRVAPPLPLTAPPKRVTDAALQQLESKNNSGSNNGRQADFVITSNSSSDRASGRAKPRTVVLTQNDEIESDEEQVDFKSEYRKYTASRSHEDMLTATTTAATDSPASTPIPYTTSNSTGSTGGNSSNNASKPPRCPPTGKVPYSTNISTLNTTSNIINTSNIKPNYGPPNFHRSNTPPRKPGDPGIKTDANFAYENWDEDDDNDEQDKNVNSGGKYKADAKETYATRNNDAKGGSANRNVSGPGVRADPNWLEENFDD